MKRHAKKMLQSIDGATRSA